MSVKEILERARLLIANPARWTTGVEARDKNGGQVPADSDEAVSWCAVGALFRPKGEERDSENWIAVGILHDSVKRKYGKGNIVYLNDKMGHAAVLEVFNEAIREAANRGV